MRTFGYKPDNILPLCSISTLHGKKKRIEKKSHIFED
jgi:hypothetical protein